MAENQNGQRYYDTQPSDEPNTTTDYRDPTDVEEIQEEIRTGVISPVAQDLALWIRTKMWRRHVREALARSVEYFSALYNKMIKSADDVGNRQTEVEKRQTALENQFQQVLANATQDSEVINARSSDYFGDFSVLDARLENIEKYLVGFVPQGVLITIKRTMNRLPTVYIDTWNYGLGLLPLSTEPEGLFGGTTPLLIESKIVSWTDNELVIRVPLEYADFRFEERISKDDYLFFFGTKSLMVHVDSGEPIGDILDPSQAAVEKSEPVTDTNEQLTARIAQIEDSLENGGND